MVLFLLNWTNRNRDQCWAPPGCSVGINPTLLQPSMRQEACLRPHSWYVRSGFRPRPLPPDPSTRCRSEARRHLVQLLHFTSGAADPERFVKRQPMVYWAPGRLGNWNRWAEMGTPSSPYCLPLTHRCGPQAFLHLFPPLPCPLSRPGLDPAVVPSASLLSSAFWGCPACC